MGVSDRHYFAWLTGALARFERDCGELRAIAATRRADFWVLAGGRTNPAVELVRDALGRDRTTARWLDRFARGADVDPVDMNALGDVPEDSCDVLMMTRASYMIHDPSAFLRDTWKILRPGGLFIVDWLHGGASTASLGLPGQHDYEGRTYPFLTTYGDAESLAEFAGEFDALIAHVNRGTVGDRVAGLFGRRARHEITRAGYLDALRQTLGAAGKHLLQADEFAPHFKILFRDARYLHPLTGKFYLHLLTVLRPVGK